MKDSFILEGKKYISSKRASEISDYTSDYIGQLCRGGKLECKMVGRTWFVTEESLHLHKASVVQLEASRNRIQNIYGGKSAAPAASTVTTSAVAAKIEEKVEEKKEIVEVPALTYMADDRPLMPELKVREVAATTETATTGEPAKTIDQIVDEVMPVVNVSPIEDAVIAQTIDQTSLQTSAQTPSASDVNYREFLKTLVPGKYQHLVRSVILRRALTGTLVAVMIVGMIAIAGQPINSKYATHHNKASVADLAINVYDGLKASFNSVYLLFQSKHLADSGVAPVRPVVEDASDTASSTPNGIAVVGSSGSADMDAATKSKIQSSFSDDVTISPDKNGNSGVITPVFKNTPGKDFVYVLVPVKDGAKPAQPKVISPYQSND